MSTRNAFLSTPHEIEVVIDFNTMRAPDGLPHYFQDGVNYEFSQLNPVVLGDYRVVQEVETWLGWGAGFNGQIPFLDQIKRVDIRSMADGRRLHVDALDHEGQPILSLPQQLTWNLQRRGWVDNHMVRARDDRIPYHNPLFHIE